MAIITIQEVAQVGDKFYTPGRYEVPDQSLFYNRKSATIDFLASSLVSITDSGFQITGLMIIEASGVTLKRHDTFVLHGGLTADVDSIGRVILKDLPQYSVIHQPYQSGSDKAYLDILSDGEITIEQREGLRSADIEGGLRVTFDQSGSVVIKINGVIVGEEYLDVKVLKVSVTNNKLGSAPIATVKVTENDIPVTGLTLEAEDVQFEESGEHYTGTLLTTMDEATVTRSVTISDPRPWRTATLTFKAEDVTDVSIIGAPDRVTPGSSFTVSATPTPEFVYGTPVWEATNCTAISAGSECRIEDILDDVTLTVTWGDRSHSILVPLSQDITDFTVEGMPSEVENGENYTFSVLPIPAGADGKADFSSSIDGVLVTDHRDNTATINVIEMTQPGVITVHWGELSKDYTLTLKAEVEE